MTMITPSAQLTLTKGNKSWSCKLNVVLCNTLVVLQHGNDELATCLTRREKAPCMPIGGSKVVRSCLIRKATDGSDMDWTNH